MKRTLYTMLMASALTLPALHAHAQGLGVGVGTNANISVGTAVGSNTQSNTDTRANANTNIGINADTDTRIRSNAHNAINSRANSTATTGSYFAHGDLNNQTVMALQESLNAHGYRVNSVNGKLDHSTLTQLQRFESDQGLRASVKSRLNTRTMQQLGVGVQDLNPAAGGAVSSQTETRIRSQGNASAGFNE